MQGNLYVRLNASARHELKKVHKVIALLFLTAPLSAFSANLCTATNTDGPSDPVNKNSGKGASDYLQNSYITCAASGDVTVGTGGRNGYSTLVNPFISRDTSVVERWTNAGKEPNGTIGVTVDSGVELIAPETSKLARGVLYVRAGYYRNYSNQGNGETTEEQALNRVPVYSANNLLKVNLINNGRVINEVSTGNDDTSLPAAAAVDFGDMPIHLTIENNGEFTSHSANTVSVVAYQTIPRYLQGAELGYSLLQEDQYKYSENNIYSIVNNGSIHQFGGIHNRQGTEFDGAISLGIASAKTIEIINNGSINSYFDGINATFSRPSADIQLDSKIINNGDISSSNGHGININPKKLSGSGFGSSVGAGATNQVALNSYVKTFENFGTINAGLAGIYNAGIIENFSNYNSIMGGSHSIDSSNGIITNGINNYGKLTGDVRLGSNSLHLLRLDDSKNIDPIVNGNVVGDPNSKIIIGNGLTPTEFNAAADKTVSVDEILINLKSTLSLSNDTTWAANKITVSGNFIGNGKTTLDGNVSSNGIIEFAQPTNGNYSTLAITGDYDGNQGVIALGANLAGDDSLTDTVHIAGNTSGNTSVNVTPTAGSPGAQTVNGIEIITVGGTSAADSFSLAAPVQAGAYEYVLRQGGAQTGGQNWFLTSFLDASSPELTPTPEDDIPIYRPGTSNYATAPTINAESAALQLSTYHQRIGGQFDIDEAGLRTWLRAYYQHNKADGKDRFDYKANFSGFQAGQEVAMNRNSSGSIDRYALTVDYGHTGADFYDTLRPLASLNRRTGDLRAQSLALGGTWTRNWAETSYLDVVGQVASLRNRFTDSNDDKATQKGWRFGLSAEAGTLLADWNSVKLEGQAQLLYTHTRYQRFDDSVSHIGAYNTNFVRGRAGVRLYSSEANRLQYYGIANIIHNFTGAQAVDVGGTSVKERFNRTRAEIGFGIQPQLKKDTYAYADLRFQHELGSGKARATKIDVGLKKAF